MFRRIKLQSGIVFAELAIALPLIILLVYGLAQVSIKLFEQGRNQLADYVLEEEAHYLLQRISHQARAAKEIEAYNSSNGVKFVYHTADEVYENGTTTALTVDDVWETQYYLAHQKKDSQAIVLNAKRQDDGTFTNPITGDNSFGETSLVNLKFSELKNDSGEDTNVLHITLELESLVTGRKLKLSTAVYMPSCTKKFGLPHE